MKTKRRAGVLLHPTSLPSQHGVGDIGQGAYDFLDFLNSAGMRCWQVLPLNPTGYGDSPYQCYSAFAANPLLINLEALVPVGLLKHAELHNVCQGNGQDNTRVDFDSARTNKTALLRLAHERFLRGIPHSSYREFCTENAYWLDDYALFMALKLHFVAERKANLKSADYLDYYSRALEFHSYNAIQEQYYGGVWNTWPTAIRTREPAALRRWNERLSSEISYVRFEQYVFAMQWQKLHKRA